MSNAQNIKKMATLNITQIANRGNKFAIVSGNAILAKFKTNAEAVAMLEKKRSLFEYWANSASVSVANSAKTVVTL